MIHEKFVKSISSCETADQLKTCFNFLQFPSIKDCHLKQKLLRNLIKSKAIKLNVFVF